MPGDAARGEIELLHESVAWSNDAVRRELREEVGCDALSLHALGRIAADSGQLASLPRLFAARVSDRRTREPEESEAIDRVIPHTFRELLAQCERGQIVDGFTLAAVLRLIPHFRGDRFAYDHAAVVETIDDK